MPRNTPNHDWTLPEDDDPDYAALLDAWFDALDADLIDRPDPGATPTEAGRVLVNAADHDPPVLQYDHGDGFEQAETVTPWRRLAFTWATEDERILGEWTFDQEILADIAGRATFAHEADTAGLADTTDRLDGHGPEQYALTTGRRTITGAWTFTRPGDADGDTDEEADDHSVTFADGATLGGALGLPVYRGD